MRPPELKLGAGLDEGSNGRLLPTTSCDEYFAELALWFGLEPSALTAVLPNIGKLYSYAPDKLPLEFLL